MEIRQNSRMFGKNVAMAKAGKKTAVKESAVAYRTKNAGNAYQTRAGTKPIMQAETRQSISRWLGGSSMMVHPIVTEFDVIHTSSEGISKASVDELAAHLGITRKTMAEDIFDLSVKTLERKAPTDKLDKRTSAHALEIARVLQHAFDVFEDEEKVKRWINKENSSLNGMKPVALFDTLTGLNLVNDILGRIEEGVYS